MAWRFRRALVVVASLAASGFSMVHAQPRLRPPAKYVELNPPDQKEGAEILDQLRDVGFGGSHYLEFELRILPRAGDERRLHGRWFGDRNATGPVTRIELATDTNTREIWLVQSGPQPAVWRLNEGREATLVQGDDAAQSLAGTNLSAADVQTPFMYWKDFVFEGRERFRQRPTYIFLLYPPEAQASTWPGIGAARVFIDSQFRALLQVQWLDPKGKPLKTITLLDFKQIAEQWIPKSFEARDERTRDKTRFVVTAAALDAKLPGDLFTPTGPGGPAQVEIPPEKLVQVR